MISFQLCVTFFLAQNMIGNSVHAHHRSGIGSLMKGHDEDDIHLPEDIRVKRGGGLTAAIVDASISAGASLAGTTVESLKDSSYNVAVSGSIENLSKWTLVLQGCEIKSGYMNVPMRSVAPGKREAFAGHKTGHTAKGSWVKCSFKVANEYMIHFMYSAPYSFDFHSNWLAVAVCEIGVGGECTSLNAYTMYYKNRSFMKRKEYYYRVEPVKMCGDTLCVTGVMGTNHQPTIALKVIPKYYSDLCDASKAASKDQWSAREYQSFVNSL